MGPRYGCLFPENNVELKQQWQVCQRFVCNVHTLPDPARRYLGGRMRRSWQRQSSSNPCHSCLDKHRLMNIKTDNVKRKGQYNIIIRHKANKILAKILRQFRRPLCNSPAQNASTIAPSLPVPRNLFTMKCDHCKSKTSWIPPRMGLHLQLSTHMGSCC